MNKLSLDQQFCKYIRKWQLPFCVKTGAIALAQLVLWLAVMQTKCSQLKRFLKLHSGLNLHWNFSDFWKV